MMREGRSLGSDLALDTSKSSCPGEPEEAHARSSDHQDADAVDETTVALLLHDLEIGEPLLAVACAACPRQPPEVVPAGVEV
jgi:hypothetical protein